MARTVAWCETCGRELTSPGTRTDKRFCNSTCRSKAHRSLRKEAAGELLSILDGRTPAHRWEDRHSIVDNPTEQMLAADAQRFDALAEELADSLNLPPWRHRLGQILRHRADLVEQFGEAAITAAARPAPAGTCRVCLALDDSRALGLDAPKLDTVTLRLLGPGCARCGPAVQAALDDAVAASVAAVAARQRPTASRPAPLPGPHSAVSCQTCQTSDLAAGLLAKGAYRDDAQLLDLAQRAVRAHQPQAGPQVVSLFRRGRAWHLRYRTGAAR